MKKIGFVVSCLLFWGVVVFAEQSNGVGTNETFRGPVGIQMYTLRGYCEIDVAAGLKLASDLGFRVIEPSSMFKKTPEEYRALMDQYKLKAISRNFGYNDYTTDAGIAKVVKIAKTLGVKYVGTTSFPHEDPMTEEQIKKVIAVFNAAGEKLAKEGLSFTYHNHGFEFVPWPGGKENETFYDMLVQQTNPEYVNFELDVRWIKTPTDPVALMKKYSTRWRTMHLKSDSCEAGMLFERGHIDFPSLLKAAQECGGIEAYFLESDDLRNIVPNTVDNLRYLESLK